MPRRYRAEVRSQVIELARSGARVAQLASTFGMSEAAIYLWLEQEKVDRGEIEGQSTDQALELAAARQRIRQLETELAVSRKVNEVFLTQPVSTSSAVRDSTPALTGKPPALACRHAAQVRSQLDVSPLGKQPAATTPLGQKQQNSAHVSHPGRGYFLGSPQLGPPHWPASW
jgi:transposase